MLAPANPELVRYLSDNPGAVVEEAAKLNAVTPRDEPDGRGASG